MKQANTLRTFFADYETMLLSLLATAMSAGYTMYYFLHGQTLAYGDAESHINIAKRVVSGLTPGFGQLGGNWLPLQHILVAPLVWNDWLWRTGIGGAVVSMLAFVFSSILVYKLVLLITEKRIAAMTAYLAFVLNLNIAYMQSVPMTEMPLIACMLASVYYFTKWAKLQAVHFLVLAAFFGLCGTLVRYDAWFLVGCEALGLIVIGIIYRWRWIKLEGLLILSGVVSTMGVGLWLLWNYLIFKQPLYFLSSPYSAKAQQLAFLQRGQLPSLHNWASSLHYYTQAFWDSSACLSALLVGPAGSVMLRLWLSSPLPARLCSTYLAYTLAFQFCLCQAWSRPASSTTCSISVTA
jgi:4-amino-4-deoxy-L-arabinose transferase-like glycosyltransferase